MFDKLNANKIQIKYKINLGHKAKVGRGGREDGKRLMERQMEADGRAGSYGEGDCETAKGD
jgi:hypothetical protein